MPVYWKYRFYLTSFTTSISSQGDRTELRCLSSVIIALNNYNWGEKKDIVCEKGMEIEPYPVHFHRDKKEIYFVILESNQSKQLHTVMLNYNEIVWTKIYI